MKQILGLTILFLLATYSAVAQGIYTCNSNGCPSGCTAAATVPTVVLSPFFNIAETGSSVADVMTVDYFDYQQILAR